MANKEISGLTAAAALAAADLFIASQGGNSRKATVEQLRSFMYPRSSYVAGNWYNLYGPGSYSSGVAGVQNNIHLTPFFLPTAITISDLGLRVATAHAGGNVQLAIYAMSSTTGKPTGNALAVTGSISTTSSGTQSADITGANVTLQPGWYYGASNTDDGTAQFCGFNSNIIQAGYVAGTATLANLYPTNTSGTFYYGVSQAFGTWPDLTSATFLENASTAFGGALIAVKAA